jgi:protein-tyrosine sulfotransferase
MVSRNGENLVFLLSLPRSGSTILSLLLGSHSRVLCPPEPWFLLRLSSLGTETSGVSRFDDNLAAIGSAAFLASADLNDSARAFARAAYNMKLRKHKKEIFVDKTPRYYHILQFIDRLFPESKKVWLKRNPLDIAASYKSQWNVQMDVITGKHPSPASFDFSVGLFELSSYFSKPSPNKFQICYEDLVQSPVKYLKMLCAFLKVRFEDGMLRFNENKEAIAEHTRSPFGDKQALFSTGVSSSAVGKWSESLSRAELEELVQLLGIRIFGVLGYDTVAEELLKLGIEFPHEEDARARRLHVANSNINPMEELALVAEERLSEMQRKDSEIQSLLSSLRERDDSIGKISREAELRLADRKRVDAAVERERQETTQLRIAVQEMDKALNEKEEQIGVLAGAREEQERVLKHRDEVLKRQEMVIKQVSREAEKRLAEMQAKDTALREKEEEIVSLAKALQDHQRMLKERDEVLKQQEKLIKDVSREAEKRLVEMQAKDAALREKEEALQKISRAAERRLEEMKRMVEEMRPKERVIAELKTAAEERLRALEAKETDITQLDELLKRQGREIRKLREESETKENEVRRLLLEVASLKHNWGYRLARRFNRERSRKE